MMMTTPYPGTTLAPMTMLTETAGCAAVATQQLPDDWDWFIGVYVSFKDGASQFIAVPTDMVLVDFLPTLKFAHPMRRVADVRVDR